MTPETVGPVSRPVDVVNLSPQGLQVHFEATAEECAVLARDFNLPAIRKLAADYRITCSDKGVHVEGKLTAAITQNCVITLEPFDSVVEEEVAVDFAETQGLPEESPADMHEIEPPDEIVNGQIDLGALTAEFLALGLDPYPRKPDADFQFDGGGDRADSPFAALGKLKGEG